MSLNDFKPMQERCSNCSYCKFIPFDKVVNQRFSDNCPSVCYYNFNTYSARGRFQLGLAVNNDDQEITEGLSNIVHECLSCGACDVACKICRYNLEPLEHNVALKEEIIKRGGSSEAHERVKNALETEQTMLPGMKKADRSAWAKGIEVKNALKEEAEILFFAGCQYSYADELKGKAAEMLKFMLENGADVAILGDAECCCAARAWQMGMADEFNQRANENIKAIKASGAKLIVTPCADCSHAFKRLYAPLGLDIEVLHFSEYLARMVQQGKLKFTKSLNIKVTYHDPCHLGRQGEPYVAWNGHEKKILNQVHTWEPRRPRYNGAYGIYDAPREVIAAIPGVELVEMTRIREYSWCCGAGGGCTEVAPDFSDWTARERMEEAHSTSADALVTACPWCVINLSKAEKDGMEIIELFDLVKRAL